MWPLGWDDIEIIWVGIGGSCSYLLIVGNMRSPFDMKKGSALKCNGS